MGCRQKLHGKLVYLLICAREFSAVDKDYGESTYWLSESTSKLWRCWQGRRRNALALWSSECSFQSHITQRDLQSASLMRFCFEKCQNDNNFECLRWFTKAHHMFPQPSVSENAVKERKGLCKASFDVLFVGKEAFCGKFVKLLGLKWNIFWRDERCW